MRKTFWIGTASLAVSLAFAASCSHSPRNSSLSPASQILIQDVTLISPERDEPFEHASVLIENGRIAKVAGMEDIKPTIGMLLISGQGKYLIPGLMDAHVHLAGVPGLKDTDRSLDPNMIQEYEKQLPRSYLYFGYTTLVDLNAVDPKLLKRFRDSPLRPDLYDCAGALAMVDGYPMNYVSKPLRYELFPNFIINSSEASSIPSGFRPSDHTPAAAVRRVKSQGGICAKTYWEIGFGREKLRTPTRETLLEISSHARQAGLVSLIHANSFEAQEAVVETGFDAIVHGLWNWNQFRNEKELPQPIRQILDEVVTRKIGYMPTFQVLGGLQALFDPFYLDDPQLNRVLPERLIQYLRSPEGAWFKNLLNEEEGDGASLTIETHKPLIEKLERVTKYLAQKNANLIFGSDTPSAPTYGNVPGYNGYLEMHHWVRAGVSLKRLLHAATLGSAKLFRLDSKIGSIEPGKAAHLLLLTKNPYQTVEAYDHIDYVILGGRAVQRQTLRAD